LLSEEFQHNFYPNQLCNNAHHQVWQYAIHTTHGMPLAPPRYSCHLRSNSYVTFCSGNALIVQSRIPLFLHSLLFLQREQYDHECCTRLLPFGNNALAKVIPLTLSDQLRIAAKLAVTPSSLSSLFCTRVSISPSMVLRAHSFK